MYMIWFLITWSLFINCQTTSVAASTNNLHKRSFHTYTPYGVYSKIENICGTAAGSHNHVTARSCIHPVMECVHVRNLWIPLPNAKIKNKNLYSLPITWKCDSSNCVQKWRCLENSVGGINTFILGWFSRNNISHSFGIYLQALSKHFTDVF